MNFMYRLLLGRNRPQKLTQAQRRAQAILKQLDKDIEGVQQNLAQVVATLVDRSKELEAYIAANRFDWVGRYWDIGRDAQLYMKDLKQLNRERERLQRAISG